MKTFVGFLYLKTRREGTFFKSIPRFHANISVHTKPTPGERTIYKLYTRYEDVENELARLFFLGGFYLPLVQTLVRFISGLNDSAFMGCKWEMRPAAETTEPDKCTTSHYLSTSCWHIKHPQHPNLSLS